MHRIPADPPTQLRRASAHGLLWRPRPLRRVARRWGRAPGRTRGEPHNRRLRARGGRSRPHPALRRRGRATRWTGRRPPGRDPRPPPAARSRGGERDRGEAAGVPRADEPVARGPTLRRSGGELRDQGTCLRTARVSASADPSGTRPAARDSCLRAHLASRAWAGLRAGRALRAASGRAHCGAAWPLPLPIRAPSGPRAGGEHARPARSGRLARRGRGRGTCGDASGRRGFGLATTLAGKPWSSVPLDEPRLSSPSSRAPGFGPGQRGSGLDRGGSPAPRAPRGSVARPRPRKLPWCLERQRRRRRRHRASRGFGRGPRSAGAPRRPSGRRGRPRRGTDDTRPRAPPGAVGLRGVASETSVARGSANAGRRRGERRTWRRRCLGPSGSGGGPRGRRAGTSGHRGP